MPFLTVRLCFFSPGNPNDSITTLKKLSFICGIFLGIPRAMAPNVLKFATPPPKGCVDWVTAPLDRRSRSFDIAPKKGRESNSNRDDANFFSRCHEGHPTLVISSAHFLPFQSRFIFCLTRPHSLPEDCSRSLPLSPLVVCPHSLGFHSRHPPGARFGPMVGHWSPPPPFPSAASAREELESSYTGTLGSLGWRLLLPSHRTFDTDVLHSLVVYFNSKIGQNDPSF